MEDGHGVYSVKVKHIYNACAIYESQGVKLLSDPWLNDGAFEGSWAAYPPLKTKPEDILNCDYLFISHLHPDHYDEETLRHFSKKIPIVIYENAKGFNYLKNKLMALGFENFISLKHGETYVLPPFKLTAYGPFAKHIFHESQLGSFIDSALVIEADGEVVGNFNDNTPSLDAAKLLRKKHGPFRLAQLKDSLAGPYPSCFPQLTDYEKEQECLRLVNRQMDHVLKIASALDAKYFQPFASQYRLQGKYSYKNAYLGVANPFTLQQRICRSFRHIEPAILGEKDVINLTTGEIAYGEKNQMDFLIWEKLYATKKYPYENDALPTERELRDGIQAAFKRLRVKQEKLKCFMDINLVLQVVGAPYYVASTMSLRIDRVHPTQTITAKISPRLLWRILNKRAHWNSSTVGCHVDFIREPMLPYNPDFDTVMSFFHL